MIRFYCSAAARCFRTLPISSAAAAAAIVLSALCSRSEAEVVARISGTDVNSEQIRAYIESVGAQDQAALAKDPAALTQLVRAYLARQALLKEAQAKKWDQQPAVKAQLDRMREQALIELYLDSVSRPPDSFPTDAEVKAAYEANKGAFEIPRQFQVAQIYIGVPKGSEAATEEKARRRVDEISRKLKQKGANFAAIARADSEEKQSGPQGGEIG